MLRSYCLVNFAESFSVKKKCMYRRVECIFLVDSYMEFNMKIRLFVITLSFVYYSMHPSKCTFYY